MNIGKNFPRLVLLVGLLAVFVSTVAAAGQVGQILAAKVEGGVTVTLPDKSNIALHNGDTVSPGSLVMTAPGANVVLVFSNGATVELSGDSQLSVDQFLQDPFDLPPTKASQLTEEPSTSHTKMNLTRGELVAHVAHLHLDQGSEFSVQTPVGAAGIRGTTFHLRIQVLSDGSVKLLLSVTEGVIKFTLPDGRPVTVTAGNTLVLAKAADGAITIEVQPTAALAPPIVPPPPRTTPGDGA